VIVFVILFYNIIEKYKNIIAIRSNIVIHVGIDKERTIYYCRIIAIYNWTISICIILKSVSITIATS